MTEKQVVIFNSPSFTSSLFPSKSEDTPPVFKKVENSIPKKRGRKPGKSKMYFTSDTEDAIVRYVKEKNKTIKDKIYNEEIKYAIEKLAENIINTFSFSYIADSYKNIQTEVVSHILLNMDKFNPTKGKAFSYFSIVVKNYLIIANNQSYSELKSNYSIETDENSDYYEFDIIDENIEKNIKAHEVQEFVKLMVDYWEVNVSTIFKKKRDIDIAYAVVELFKNVAALEFFNKKALYLLIREMTGYKTQYIIELLIKYIHYEKVKLSYYNTGVITEQTTFFSKK